MNFKSFVVILSVLSVVFAQNFECVANTTAFQACLNDNPTSECNWSTVGLWSNCNNNYPSANNYDAYINQNLNTSLLINANTVIGNLNLGANAAGSTQELDIATPGSLTLITANLVNGAIVKSNAPITVFSFVMNTGSSLTMSGNTFNSNNASASLTVQQGATISFGSNSGNNVPMNINGNIAVADTLTVNQPINVMGSLQLVGNNSFNGGSTLVANGTVSIKTVGESSTTSFGVSTILSNLQIVNTSTVAVTNGFQANSIGIDVTGSLNIASSQLVVISNFENSGTINWSSSNVIVTSKNGNIINQPTGSLIVSGAGSTFESVASFQNHGTINFAAATFFNTSTQNWGTINTNAVTTFNNTQNDFDLTLNGGSLTGTGSIILTNSLVVAGTSTVSVSSLTIGDSLFVNSPSVLNLNTPVTITNDIYINGTIELGVNFTNGLSNNLTGYEGVMSTANSANFINNGFLYGTMTFNEVDFTHNGYMGSVVSPVEHITINGAQMVMSNASITYVAISSTTSPFTINSIVNGSDAGIVFGGNLTVVLRNGFNPQTGDNITIFSLNGNTTATGAFLEINLIIENGANGLNCSYVSSTPNSIVTYSFTGCNALPGSGSNKTLIIIISVVVSVVVVIIIIVAVVVYRRRQHATTAEKQRLI